jgi:hypothetical protein
VPRNVDVGMSSALPVFRRSGGAGQHGPTARRYRDGSTSGQMVRWSAWASCSQDVRPATPQGRVGQRSTRRADTRILLWT